MRERPGRREGRERSRGGRIRFPLREEVVPKLPKDSPLLRDGEIRRLREEGVRRGVRRGREEVHRAIDEHERARAPREPAAQPLVPPQVLALRGRARARAVSRDGDARPPEPEKLRRVISRATVGAEPREHRDDRVRDRGDAGGHGGHRAVLLRPVHVRGWEEGGGRVGGVLVRWSAFSAAAFFAAAADWSSRNVREGDGRGGRERVARKHERARGDGDEVKREIPHAEFAGVVRRGVVGV